MNAPKVSAAELWHVAFPHCSRRCSAVEEFGVCECDCICPHKFDHAGEPYGPATIANAQPVSPCPAP